MSSRRIGSLFSGYGGLDLALESLLDAQVAWHVEIEDAPSRVLATHWPLAPNLGDITKIDWPTVDPVDILCGGFPCQDLSLAGRRKGMRPGTRSGLWSDFKAAIAALQPRMVVIENVRGLVSGCAESDLEPCPGCVGDDKHRPPLRALGRVLGDLADLGFDAEWAGIRASDVGAPHARYRVFVLAYSRGLRRESGRGAAPGQAASGRASAVVGGRDGASLTLLPTPRATSNRTSRGAMLGPSKSGLSLEQALEFAAGAVPRELLPTPVTEPSTGNGHARNLAAEVRPVKVAALLPTPAAMNPNDEEELDTWRERRERVKRQKRNGNGFGTPLGVAVRILAEEASDDESAALFGFETEVGGADLSHEPWGRYAGAIRNWEALTRPAPSPTKPDGRDGAHRLSAEFAEWMMGLPSGWVTDPGIGVTRRHALRMLGNGVVPQQAYAAVGGLLERAEQAVA